MTDPTRADSVRLSAQFENGSGFPGGASIEALLANIERSALDHAVENAKRRIAHLQERVTRYTESPIEAKLLAAIFVWMEFTRHDGDAASTPGPIHVGEFNDNADIHAPRQGATASERFINLGLQVQIGRHRVDFLFRVDYLWTDERRRLFVVVECDGHDFHERTKEQAIRDRSRDRELQSLGYIVLRFTGREIHRSPYHCAKEIESIIDNWVSAQRGSIPGLSATIDGIERA